MTPRERRLAALKKYNDSPKGKAAAARYAASGKKKTAQMRWNKTPEGRKSLRGIMQRWRETHREADKKYRNESLKRLRERGYFHEWRRLGDNAEKANTMTRIWKKENREAVRMHNANRLAMKKGAAGTFNRDDIETLLEAQDEYCLCGTDISVAPYHIDHIVPLSRGGSNWPSNLQLLCAPCNLSKHNSVEWQPKAG